LLAWDEVHNARCDGSLHIDVTTSRWSLCADRATRTSNIGGRDNIFFIAQDWLLFSQFFVQCHGFDMGENLLPWLQPQSHKRFFGDAGYERGTDVQQYIH
jgi:hypothetical protein